MFVGYASKHGGTAEIADAIGATLRHAGHDADVVPCSGAVENVDYDAFVLGSALYAGSWLSDALGFVDRYADTVSSRPCWLFSSGPLGEPAEIGEEQPAELGDLTARLHPRWHTVFPGRYDPDLVGFGERMIMKAVKAEPGDYRDWEAIGAWAREIASELSSS